MTRKFKHFSVCLPLIPATLLLCLARFSDPGFVDRLTAEDGLIENLSAACYLLGFSFCFYRLFVIRQKPRGILLLWMFFCLLFFGEETSWLQRVIGFETPQGIISTQDEFNLHNLASVQSIVETPEGNYALIGAQNLFRVGFMTYFVLLPFVGNLKGVGNRLSLYPLPSRRFALSMVLIVGMTAAFSLFAGSHQTKSAIGEIHEFFYAYAILFYVVETLRLPVAEPVRAFSSPPVPFRVGKPVGSAAAEGESYEDSSSPAEAKESLAV